MDSSRDGVVVDCVGYVKRGARVASWPNKRFVVYEFWVVHGQLVLRCQPSDDGSAIDCYFSGVDRLKLNAVMTGLEIFLGDPEVEMYSGVYVYIVESAEMVGWIVSSKMRVVHVGDNAKSHIQRP